MVDQSLPYHLRTDLTAAVRSAPRPALARRLAPVYRTDGWGPFALLTLCVLANELLSYRMFDALSDQVSQLPLIYHAMTGELGSDWYVNQMSSGVSVRSLYVAMAAGLGRLIGLEGALVVLHALAAALTVTAAWRFVRKVLGFGAVWAILAVVAALVFNAALSGAGEGEFFEVGAIPRNIAKTAVLLALVLSCERRHGLALGLCLAGGLMHPPFALFLGLPVALTAWLYDALPRRPRSGWAMAAFAAAFAALMFGGALTAYALAPDPALVDIVAAGRNPHHFLPSVFMGWRIAAFLLAVTLGAALVAGLGAVCVRGRRLATVRLTVGASLIASLVTTLAALLVLAWPSAFLIALQGFRYWYVPAFFALMALVAVLRAMVRDRWGGDAAWRFAGIIRQPQAAVALLAANGLLAGLLLSAMAGGDVGQSLSRLLPFCPSARCVAERLTASAEPRVAQMGRTALVLARLTGPAETILAPPDFSAVRVLARRALVVDFKSWPFGDARGWARRMADVYGPRGGRGGFGWLRASSVAYAALPCAQLETLARRYGARVIVREGGACPGAMSLAVAGRFTILRLGVPMAAAGSGAPKG